VRSASAAPLLQPGRIAVSRQLPWMGGTTVTLDQDGNVDAFYPPPPGVYGQHCTDAGHFMAVNICSLSRDTWSEVGERLDRHVAAGQTGTFYESVFEEMAAECSMAPAAVVFPSERWYEIDTLADLDAAERVFPRHLHVASGSGRRALSAGVAGRVGAPHASIASTQQFHPAARTAAPRWSPAAASAAAARNVDRTDGGSPGIRP
jgi:hypothetical protein